MNSEHRKALQSCLPRICSDVDCAAMMPFLATLLTSSQREELQAINRQDARNARLVSMVCAGGPSAFDLFIRALHETKKHHVANEICDHLSKGRMRREYQMALRMNCDRLSHDLHAEEVLPILMSQEIITRHQYEYIQAKPSRMDRVQALLSALMDRSDRVFFAFGAALRQTGQSHLCDELLSTVHELTLARDKIDEKASSSSSGLLVHQSPATTRQKPDELAELQNILVKFYETCFKETSLRSLPSVSESTIPVCVYDAKGHQIARFDSSYNYASVLLAMKPRKLMLLEGPPGIGKSTIMQRIAQDWAAEHKKAGLYPYDLVILVEFRKTNKQQYETIEAMTFAGLEHICQLKSCNFLRKIFQATGSRQDLDNISPKLLLLLDGYDEGAIGQCIQLENLFNDYNSNKTDLLPYDVLVSSRPNRIYGKSSYATAKVTGFDQKLKMEYINNVIQKKSEKKEIKKKLENSQSLNEMAVVPMFLTFICLCGINMKNDTIAGLYQEIFAFMLKRLVEKKRKNPKIAAEKFEFEDELGKDKPVGAAVSSETVSQELFTKKWDILLQKLGFLSFQLLVEEQNSDEIASQTFPKESIGIYEFNSMAQPAGLLIDEGATYSSPTLVRLSHKTFQEYLAAAYYCFWRESNLSKDCFANSHFTPNNSVEVFIWRIALDKSTGNNSALIEKLRPFFERYRTMLLTMKDIDGSKHAWDNLTFVLGLCKKVHTLILNGDGIEYEANIRLEQMPSLNNITINNFKNFRIKYEKFPTSDVLDEQTEWKNFIVSSPVPQDYFLHFAEAVRTTCLDLNFPAIITDDAITWFKFTCKMCSSSSFKFMTVKKLTLRWQSSMSFNPKIHYYFNQFLDLFPNLSALDILWLHDLSEKEVYIPNGERFASLQLSHCTFDTIKLANAPNLRSIILNECSLTENFHCWRTFVTMMKQHGKIKKLELTVRENFDRDFITELKCYDNLTDLTVNYGRDDINTQTIDTLISLAKMQINMERITVSNNVIYVSPYYIRFLDKISAELADVRNEVTTSTIRSRLAKSKVELSALSKAVLVGDAAVVASFMEDDDNITRFDPEKVEDTRTPLHHAVVASLVEYDDNISRFDPESDEDACTPLPHTVYLSNNSIEICQILLKNISPLEQTTDSRRSALHYACSTGQVELVELLLKAAAAELLKNISNKTTVYNCVDVMKRNPMHYVSQGPDKPESAKIVHLLIQHCGEAPEFVKGDESNATPLILAVDDGNVCVVREMLKYKIFQDIVNCQDIEGKNARDFAKGREEMLDVLEKFNQCN